VCRVIRGGVLDRLAGRGLRRPGDDRGAVAVIVAILLGGGVLLGFLALTVDVGELYLEHQQLQSGADSAALAVAKACATNAPQCTDAGTILAFAQHYADQNSDDQTSHVAEVCGTAPGGQLNSCGPPNNNNLADCIGDPPGNGAPYVEVRLSTQTLDGKFVLPPVFAQTMAGNEGYTGAAVGACARAGWGAGVNVLAMAISECEYNTTHVVSDPQNPQPSDQHVFMIWAQHFDCQDPGLRSNYQPPPPSGDNPRDFGYGQIGFVNDGLDCAAAVPANGHVQGLFWEHRRGTILPSSCETALRLLWTSGETIYLPVYDHESGPQDNINYHVQWLAPFVVTGFQFGPPTSGHDEPSVLSGGHDPCTATRQRCVSGYFTGPLISIANGVPSNDAHVKLIG
jgi:putative Flp pilus-assembly TadE/G-like protein